MNQNAFWKAPLPMLLIDPISDQLLLANHQACLLLKSDLPTLKKHPVSRLFSSNLPQLIVFTHEAIEQGVAWSDGLFITAPETNHELRCEASASSFIEDDKNLLTITLQDCEMIQRQRNRAEAQQHYRSGITHWQRMATVFQEFEKENRLLLEAAGEGIYGVDANGLTTFVNPAAERILGWKADELIGKNMHKLIHNHHADGSDFHVNDCPIYQAFQLGTVCSIDDDIFWSKDRRALDVEYTSTPIKDNGHVVGAVIVFRDITEKKQSKKRLLEALEEVENLKHRLELENAYLQEEISSEYNHHKIIGKSTAIQQVIEKIQLVSSSDATVLITGESGTGKELIARAIHEYSLRSKRSLIRVNCAAIPQDLFESEFFGHIKGAFTGATSDRMGRFELADGGTLFLDEVGEIPLPLQGKLLRVLQEQQFERVGDAKTKNVDVRIIAATNKDLKALVARGAFREDLYFRLNVFPIESVPLRSRIDDIPMLAQHFLQRASTKANKSGFKISLSQTQKLMNYDWPGNIRELENVIERQVILSKDLTLRFDDLISSTPAPANDITDKSAEHPITINRHIPSELDLKTMQKQQIITALRQCNGKVFGANGAAELLGLKPTTLSSRMKKFNIDRIQFQTR